MAIHTGKLHRELVSAGLPVVSVSINGRVDWGRALSAEEEAAAASLIAAHDPARPLPEEQDETAAKAARGEFRQLPGWASWSPGEGRAHVRGAVLNGQTADEVEAWVMANVTNLAQARAALVLLARNLVALREIVAVIAGAVLLLRDVAVRRVDAPQQGPRGG